MSAAVRRRRSAESPRLSDAAHTATQTGRGPAGEPVCMHDNGGCVNACSLEPILAVESPRCRPYDHALPQPHQPRLLATATGAARCPKLLRRICAGAQGLGAYGRTYLLERAPRTYRREPHVPTGESPTYLPERAPRTYRREPHVPTGESPRTYRREPHVPTGESPSYLLERAHVPTGESPRTYRREPLYLLERAHVPTGERQASNLLFWKGLETRRLYRRLEEDTDNRVCVV